MFTRLATAALAALLTISIVLAPAVVETVGANGTYVPSLHLCDGGSGNPDGGNYPSHSTTTFHPLLVYRASPNQATPLCTYGHAHGQDPMTSPMNTIFGSLPSAAFPSGQSISYAWATSGENACDTLDHCKKHSSYMWITFANGGDGGCHGETGSVITAFRALFHNDGNLGVTNRFHSFWIQAQFTNCNTGAVGWGYFGGHQDYADPIIGAPGTSPSVTVTSPTPTTAAPSDCIINGDARTEGHYQGPTQSQSVWYGNLNRAPTGNCDDVYGQSPPNGPGQWGFNNNLGTDSFGPVDPSNLSSILFYADSLRPAHRHTAIGTDDIQITTDPSFFCATGSTCTGVTGYATVHGVIDSGCSSASATCVPFRYQNIHPCCGSNVWTAPFGPSRTVKHIDYDADVPGPVGGSNPTGGYYVIDQQG